MNSTIKYILIFFTLLSLTKVNLLAQSDSTIAKNTIFVEGLGNGGFGSVNFDHLLFVRNNFKLASRIGVFFLPREDPNLINKKSNFWSALFELNTFWGGKGNFEMGIGISFMKGASAGSYTAPNGETTSHNSSSLYIVPRILGFRFQKSIGGFFCKTGILALIQIAEFDKVTKNDPSYKPDSWPYFSIGLGYTIKKKLP